MHFFKGNIPRRKRKKKIKTDIFSSTLDVRVTIILAFSTKHFITYISIFQKHLISFHFILIISLQEIIILNSVIKIKETLALTG